MTLIGTLPRSVSKVEMTEAEYLCLEDRRVEWAGGYALFMSPVSIPHARITGWLFRMASRLSEKSGAGEVFGDGVAHRSALGSYTVPDMLFVARERLDRVKATHVEGPADLIVEVVSAESRVRDYHEKYAEYESAGVREYWIIDPVYQTIDLYGLVNGAYVKVEAKDGRLASSVLPGFVLSAEMLKQWPLPLPEGA